MKALTLKFATILMIIAAFSCNKKMTGSPEPQSTAAADPALVDAGNRFGLELFKMVSSGNENIIVSPWSVSTAMAMTYGGAAGETEKQMAAVLHFEPNTDDFHAKYSAYIEAIRKLDGKGIQLHVANALWAQKNYDFRKEYLKSTTSHYGAALKYADFRGNTEGARKAINEWTEAETEKKITNLLAPGMLNDMTRLVLVNAIYFQSNWEKQFDKKKTTVMDFFMDENTRIQVPFMVAEDNFGYSKNENCELLRLDYKGGNVSMIILLPLDKNGLNDLIQSLTVEKFNAMTSDINPLKTRVLLPKFKTTSEFELSDVLKKMGMPHPFSTEADLSLMTGKKDLQIDKVVHKAFIEVDETGTEAAAATAVVIREKSAPVGLQEFRADHPFMFVIRDNSSGTILFSGKIFNPEK